MTPFEIIYFKAFRSVLPSNLTIPKETCNRARKTPDAWSGVCLKSGFGYRSKHFGLPGHNVLPLNAQPLDSKFHIVAGFEVGLRGLSHTDARGRSG